MNSFYKMQLIYENLGNSSLDLENIKQQVAEYNGSDTWEEFIDNQEIGECQFIASVLKDFGFDSVFGEIEIDDEYIDEDGDPQNLVTHHWSQIGDVIYDFSKGTLKDHIEWGDLYGVEVDGEEWRYNPISKR